MPASCHGVTVRRAALVAVKVGLLGPRDEVFEYAGAGEFSV
jgi:hypothetical protein